MMLRRLYSCPADLILLHAEKLDVEQQRSVRRDRAASAPGAIAHLRRNDEGALAADLHAGYAFIPALDDLAFAEAECEWLAAIDGRVELGALVAILIEPAGVVHRQGIAGL